MNADARLQRRSDVTFQSVAGEAILIRMDTGTYFSLNKIGTELWHRLDGQRSLEQHAQAIADKYNLILQGIVNDTRQLAATIPGQYAAQPRLAANAVRELAKNIPVKYEAEAPAVVNVLNKFADQVEGSEAVNAQAVADALLKLSESFPERYGVVGQMFINDFIELARRLAADKLVDVV